MNSFIFSTHGRNVLNVEEQEPPCEDTIFCKEVSPTITEEYAESRILKLKKAETGFEN